MALDEGLWLKAEDIRDTASLYMNEIEGRHTVEPPYHWNITLYVEKGSNPGRSANTLDNLYGKSALSQPNLGCSNSINQFT